MTGLGLVCYASRGHRVPQGKEGRHTTDEERALDEDTFILAGQPYVYTEQDWTGHTRAANDAYNETRAAYFIYLFAHASRHTVIEDGASLTPDEVRRRAIEFAGGLARLRPFVTVPTYFSLARN